jgi:RimJ/RimL family protein N-acetyltransferase
MILQGPTVVLRPMAREDTADVLRWRADPAVARQMFSERAPTREEHEAWLAALAQSPERMEFVIALRAGGRAVGTIGLSRIQPPGGSAEYGILLGEADARGRGIAREASELLLAYGFDELGLDELFLNLFADNTAARRLYERLGFREDPARGGVREKDGALRKTVCMRLPACARSTPCCSPRTRSGA